MRKIFFLVFFLCLGCAQTKWTKPGATQEDFNREAFDCQKIAEMTAANYGYHGNILIIGGEQKKCLRLKYGWTPQ